VDNIKVLNNRYEIINMISISEGAKVYLGIDKLLGVTRVIKEIKKDTKNELGEFEILKGLNHIGLPHIYDAFENQENNYIVIEHIDGKNLKEVIKEKGVISEEKGLKIIKELLYTVNYLHTIRPKPIVHGDIKPSNIVITDKRTVLIDFASVNNEKGTSSFFAPERLIGLKKSFLSDIYSIGLLIHYIFTGKNKKIFNNDDINLNQKLKSIIDKCTKKKPNDRYKNIGLIITDIEKIQLHRNSNETSKTICKIISIQGCSLFTMEFSYILSKYYKKKVLLIDTNIFDSEIELKLVNSQCKLYIQDFIMGDSNKLFSSKQNKNLYILPCRAEVESYETLNPNIIEKIIKKYYNKFDIIIINSNDFIYDALCMSGIYLSDMVIYTIQKGITDIRKYNAIINFLYNRQNILKTRFTFVQFNIYNENIRKSLTSKAIEGKWLGSIPYSNKRMLINSIGGNYSNKMEIKIRRKYIKLIKRLNV